MMERVSVSPWRNSSIAGMGKSLLTSRVMPESWVRVYSEFFQGDGEEEIGFNDGVVVFAFAFEDEVALTQ